jgi:cellulose synthase/poly-beta-1,6-N-acetylglucosamine synthase-like glycosyltransferase
MCEKTGSCLSASARPKAFRAAGRMSGALHFVLVGAFWGAAVLTLYTYVGYPAWIYFRSRWHAQTWRQAPIFPTVSIILVVHNGAALLRRQINRLLSLDYPADRFDLVVVSDGSTDNTDEILNSISHPAVKSIRCPERRGKAAAVNIGMQNSSGEIQLFVDIRPELEIDAVKLLVSNFSDPSVGCATGELILHDEGHTTGAKAVGGFYWRYEAWIRKCESLVDSPLGVYGGFYAVRRELARALPEGSILDDVWQPLSVIRQGFRSIVDDRARVHDTWPANLKGEFNRKVRTLAGNFQLLQQAPWVLSRENRLRFELISHKLMRLLVPVLLVALLISSSMLAFSSRFYAGALAGQLLLCTIAAVGTRCGLPIVVRIAGAGRAFCMLNAAIVVGFYKFLFVQEQLWKIWVPTAGLPPAVLHEEDKAERAA